MKYSAVALFVSLFSLYVFSQNSPTSSQGPNLSSRPSIQTAFRVKYVAQGTVYLAAGRSAGLAAGMKLIVKRVGNVSTSETTGEGTGAETVAELEVLSLTETSAVCNVGNATAELVAGDYAYFTEEQVETIVQQQALGGSRKYAQVVTFTEGDPMEEEVRDSIPRPPLAEVNRVRGRFGFDYSGIRTRGSSARLSSQVGMVLRADITRMGGTYWNLSGYWRGRLNRTSSDQQQSLQDLINRTYHLSMTYDNPNSKWVAGFGRLYVPWASSLETLDGGYFGRRLSKSATAGVFAGTTPDPTSWNYDPNRRLGGAFINFSGGSFDNVHYSSTSGAGVSMLQWNIDRPFIFFENSVSYKRYLSLYHSLQADDPKDASGALVGAGVSRSFVTVRFQPHQRVSFDVNHNYMREVPTFDPRLIGTGLLDKYLFQGLSFGTRVETWHRISLYTNIGRSSRSGDAKPSWNQMYGVSAGRIWRTGLRADFRYSEFDSSFGKGNYQAFTVSRYVGEDIRLEMQLGKQSLQSRFSSQTGSHFLNTNAEVNLGSRYFMQAGFNTDLGGAFAYDQWSVTLGYRFDNRNREKH